jgi:diguanylate cyclase (GGDEF)-like protein
MGNNGASACPAVGSELQQSLTRLQNRFEEELSPALIQEIAKKLSEQLDLWGGRASQYFKSETDQIKSLLFTMARAAESMGSRDNRHSQQMGQFSTHLRDIAAIEDLSTIRSTLLRRATELKQCVDQMASENQLAMSQLKAEMTVYQNRLREAETLALKDELTGLSNRRSMESRMEAAIRAARPFCVVMIDLDNFKQVNDEYGHGPGDSLLVQFAAELRSNVRATDAVGRWGGDEFMVLLECNMATARERVKRIAEWTFGEYTLTDGAGGKTVELHVQASVGTAEWTVGETLAQLIQRADQAMYQEKKLARAAAAH